jgi:hypothetical protein
MLAAITIPMLAAITIPVQRRENTAVNNQALLRRERMMLAAITIPMSN